MDFNQYSNNYDFIVQKSLKPFGCDTVFFDRFKVNYITDHIIRGAGPFDILDFGCGIGKITTLLARKFPASTIYGYDVAADCLEEARKASADMNNLSFHNSIPLSKQYDMVLAANVFHHVAPHERKDVLCRIRDLLKLGGRIVIFEHNPYNPLTRYIVHSCPLDDGVELLTPRKWKDLVCACGIKIEMIHYVLCFPWENSMVNRLNYLLRYFPLGVQYCACLQVK